MQAAVWDRAKQIFEELADRPSGERTALLSQACNGDEELRASIEKLLAANERAGEFLRDPTLNAATLVRVVERSRLIQDANSSRPGSSANPDLANPGVSLPGVGRWIERYKLLEVIGEGGFGTVYMAEQTDPVRRRVALKIIKPGMDTRQIVARFEAERQALALMDHPNIARVLDGGESESGRPYFVMELVRGVPITQFCDEQRLTMRERLDLFRPVCQAVQHAHQKGIIHRDIKPTNVLVTLHDGKPVSKVIDFGIAKAMHTPLTEKTLFTEFRQLIGTPTYMSPEQAEMSGLDVDTRSDIYSLGVLLYELLTGTTPFDAKQLLNAGYAELQRTIKEVEPQRPSTRVGSAMRTGAAVRARARVRRGGAARIAVEDRCREPSGRPSTSTIEDIAHQRRTDAHSLSRLLRGDLDWIVMKCLEKDRSRRYGTASDLGLDLERYLRDEPVAARPPSTMYRLRKLVRRNRTAVAAGSAMVFAIGIGFAASLAGFVAARDAQHVAETNAIDARRAASQAAAVNRFLQEMLTTADPGQSGKRDMTVREALERALKQVDAGSLKGQPEIEATVRMTIGRTYAGLAQFDAGMQQLNASIDGFRKLHGEEHKDYAEALVQRGTLWKVMGAFDAAERDMRGRWRSRGARGPNELELAENLNNFACVLGDLKKNDEAEALLQEALQITRRPEHASHPLISEVLNNLHFKHVRAKEWEAAEALVREALEINRRLRGSAHQSTATNLDNLAQVQDARGDIEGAECSYREALAMRRELYGSDHPDVAWTLHNLATLLYRRKQLTECESLLRESVEILRRTHGLANEVSLHVMDSFVAVLSGQQEKLPEAEALLLAAFEAIKDHAEISAARKSGTAQTLALLYRARQQADLSEKWKQTAQNIAAQAP